jgi:hypothetical protein
MKSFWGYLESRIPPRTRVLTEAAGSGILSPTDIYDFYWLCTGLSFDQIADEDERLARFYLQEIQNLYIKVFTELLTAQIEKYVRKGRIDTVEGKPAFDSSKLRTLPERERINQIQSMMKQTFRSDMQRRNERWELIAEYLLGLANTGVTKNICYYIDRINNAVHNTRTLVLDKLPGAERLLKALDDVHRSRIPKDYAFGVSPEVRRLMKQWTGPGSPGSMSSGSMSLTV